jgi:head-tail adaptor
MSVANLIQTRGVSVTIYADTQTTVDSGGSVITTAGAGTAATAFIQPRSGSEAVRYGRENNRDFFVMYFLPSVSIRAANRVVYGSRTFDIQHVRKPDERVSGQTLAYIIAEAEETQP